MTFGGDFKRQDRNTTTDQNARGTFQFSGIATSEFVPTCTSTPTSTAASSRLPTLAWISPIFCWACRSRARFNSEGTARTSARTAWDVYANDDWRVNPNLTLMFGLRYEYYSPLSEKYGHLVNLDIAPDFSAVAPVLAGAAGPYSGAFPNSLIEPDRHNLAPRGGLAWKPSAKHSTVVRLGYGIYYNPTALNRLATELSEQPPFAETQTLTTSPPTF